jgi:hypothetical protein
LTTDTAAPTGVQPARVPVSNPPFTTAPVETGGGTGTETLKVRVVVWVADGPAPVMTTA